MFHGFNKYFLCEEKLTHSFYFFFQKTFNFIKFQQKKNIICLRNVILYHIQNNNLLK